ncbi:MAG: YdcF family protein [Clostridia bacterium]|nr:YdcF family protein [Clostridia bacterium]
MRKLLPPCTTRTDKILRIGFAVAGVLCLLYFCLVGFVAGLLHTSILFIWIVGGMLCLTIACFVPKITAWLKKTKKWVISLIAAPLALCLLLFTAGEIAILTGFVSDVPDGDADYLIILGAKVNPGNKPSLTLQNRIDAAYEYLTEHPDTVAIASGGQGADEPISEAQCIADELIKLGIDPKRILLEERSTDTAENIQYSLELMNDSPDVTVLIVSNDFHCFRASAIARRHLEADVGHLSADSVFFLLPHYMVREFAGLTVDLLKGNLEFE